MAGNTCIVVCGKKYDIGTRVVLWDEPDGLNGYDTTRYVHRIQNRKTGKTKKRVVSGYRFSRRGWRRKRTLENLRKVVTQFFLHHDGMYRAKGTFHVLHVERGLSCHFLLDDDGTIYQTIDLWEKGWHGGNCNPVAVGIEIANRAMAGRFPTAYDKYHQKRHGVGPRRKRHDVINGRKLFGYEFNDKQYAALIHLGIVMTELFPLMGGEAADFPRVQGKITKNTLAKPKRHRGFICHYHASKSKIDPISFDHQRFLDGVRGDDPDAKTTFDLTPVLALDSWLERQNALIALGYNPGGADGVLGPNTKRALKKFQKGNGLVPDGIWGPKTQAAMEKKLKR